jgi:alpha-galactosidase/6-phospho-beta-glucosidase family protein
VYILSYILSSIFHPFFINKWYKYELIYKQNYYNTSEVLYYYFSKDRTKNEHKTVAKTKDIQKEWIKNTKKSENEEKKKVGRKKQNEKNIRIATMKYEKIFTSSLLAIDAIAFVSPESSKSSPESSNAFLLFIIISSVK